MAHDTPSTSGPAPEVGASQSLRSAQALTADGEQVPMRLVIVGGVAGGMSCAARARRLNERAQITVLERGEHVSFANCGLPYFVGGEITDEQSLLVQTPERLRASLNLDVRTKHEVIAVDTEARVVTIRHEAGVEDLAYDALVLSPGASAVRPDIVGLDSPRVRTLRTVSDATNLRDAIESGARRGVVLGAGFIGLEAAEALAAQGLETTLVEFSAHVLPPLDIEHSWPVQQELERLGVDVRTRVAAETITSTPGHDVVALSDGSLIEADLIVLATGVRPETAVFENAGVACERSAILVDEHGRTSHEGIWAVGDATMSRDPITGAGRPVALAGPANRAGRLVADHIMRPDTARPIPAPLGTAIVRVGALTAALSGANRATLTRAGIDVRTLHLHPNQHAGYFPGASQIHLSVHIDPSTGQILGASAVGSDGVDKRIDILATAIRAGLAVQDLIDLDLAYSPPYGQAKDAINLVGMVGANVVDGTLRLWDAQDLDDVMAESLILDVRSDAEVATGMLAGALHIPHTELRDQIERVREAAAGRPVRVMCASGVRSAIAHRILTAMGMDSASLSGGTTTLRAVLGPRASTVLAPARALADA